MQARYCPRCRKPPPEGADICPEHQRYAVTEAALEKLAQAPLLGRALEDRYALLDWIGGGGMGSIYRAVDLRLDRPVAVKLLNAVVTQTKDAQDRFEREARAMSRLGSQHTVTLFDYGVIRDGALANVAFMVMELVEGQSLMQAIHGQGRMRGEQAAQILIQLAHSLSEAHAQGIVHRDVKPDNILLSQTHDGQLLVKLIDFGIARTGEATLTSTGAFLGTPQYMSPEQCSPENMDVDGRADQYACAIVLYELLSKKLPFDHEQPLKVIYAHLYDDLPPLPNPRGSAQLAALEVVLRRALSKDPDQRYPSIQELSKAFALTVAAYPSDGEDWSGEVELAAPSSPPPQQIQTQYLMDEGPDWPPKKRGGVLRTLLLLLLLGGVSVGVYLLGLQQRGGVDAGSALGAEDVGVVVMALGGELKPPSPTKPIKRAKPPQRRLKRDAAVDDERLDAGLKDPRSRPKPRPKPKPKAPPVAQLKEDLRAALDDCQCGAAKKLWAQLSPQLKGAERVALQTRVRRCQRPDVDQICDKGELKSN
ncbi:serine/threonine protein kinase [Myxococcota bacterium]|nr:serine/threonine protein kinase [Myxococcota bacterium]MBU1898526.1 serine/threonine protein kinase [Myxococcota bacterium]